jgi:small multidrug resistance pump
MNGTIALLLSASMVVFVTANILLRGQIDRPQVWVLLIALALFVVGNLINLEMMRQGGLALVIGLSGVGQMVLLALVGLWWFGERLSGMQMAGLALAVVAGILMLWPQGGGA